MKAVNLLLLTRMEDPRAITWLYRELSGCGKNKTISPHEAASLCSLAHLITKTLPDAAGPETDWVGYLDGFFFSYVIEHIGKEFDLLKISSDGEYVLNIELKSEEIGEERVRKQLEQNRYYLSNTAHTIFSFTYIMSTDTLYSLNEKGYLKKCGAEDLIRILLHPSLRDYLEEGIGRFFRSSDYLISPVAVPEKFLQKQYFLTNQQADFKRRILMHLKKEEAPFAAVTGIGGTGKTLLIFDLAVELSKKRKILFLHAGQLRKGHFILDRRLKNVDIRAAEELEESPDLSEYSGLIIDEAAYLSPEKMRIFVNETKKARIPLIAAYDPLQLLNERTGDAAGSETADLIQKSCTLFLAFTGNIRINRPVYSFLRTLLCLKDHPGHPDYSCIDVIYAADEEECAVLVRHYSQKGYKLINSRPAAGLKGLSIASEYDKVMFVLDENYAYDDSLHLCCRDGSEEPIRILYEGLSRTRENLCLVIKGNPKLFSEVLAIRLGNKELIQPFESLLNP